MQPDKRQEKTEARLFAEYGELLSVKDLVRILKYSSPGSLRSAHEQGLLPVSLYKFPGRRGLFAKVDEVAEAITLSMMCTNQAEVTPIKNS